MMDNRILELLVAIGESLACPECNGVGWTATPSREVPDWQPTPCRCRRDLKALCEQTRSDRAIAFVMNKR